MMFIDIAGVGSGAYSVRGGLRFPGIRAVLRTSLRGWHGHTYHPHRHPLLFGWRQMAEKASMVPQLSP